MTAVLATPWRCMLDAAGTTPALRRIGRPDDYGSSGGGGSPPSSGRDSLVYGTYEPDTTNTGVISGSVLTDYNATSATTVQIPNGAVITNKRIYGDVTFLGTATITNCRFYGGVQTITSGNTAVLNCNNTRIGVAVMTDCTITPQTPSNGRDCVLGKQFELYRCYISGGVDGVGIYSTSTTAPNVNVKVKGCLVELLTYFYPDSISPQHTDGTHNDSFQLQGGKVCEIVGNSIKATSVAASGTGTNPDKPWLIGQGYANGAALIIQDNTGAGIDNTNVITDNYFTGGLSQMNVKTGISFIYQRNHHYRATAVQSGTWSGYWFRGDDLASNNITGIDVGTNDNLWVDGPYVGTAIASPRDHGIHSNTGNY